MPEGTCGELDNNVGSIIGKPYSVIQASVSLRDEKGERSLVKCGKIALKLKIQMLTFCFHFLKICLLVSWFVKLL